MSRKLIRYEFRATARIFLPLLGAAGALSLLSWISLRLGGAQLAARMGLLHKFFGIAGDFLSACTFLSLVALMVCVVVVTVQRFYKNLLGDEGYLMLTLPATPAQHILAKLTVGTAWTAAALLVSVLAAIALSTTAVEVTVSGAVSHMTLAQAAADFKSCYGFALWRLAGLLGLLFLVGVVNTYLLAYLCMAVGSRWPQQRLGASIITFVAADFLRRIVWTAFFFLTGSLFARFAPQYWDSQGAPFVLTAFALLCGLLSLEAVLYFFAARALLQKRLNLA